MGEKKLGHAPKNGDTALPFLTDRESAVYRNLKSSAYTGGYRQWVKGKIMRCFDSEPSLSTQLCFSSQLKEGTVADQWSEGTMRGWGIPN